MSGRRSISNSFNVITVDDPVSVIAQYAPTDNPSSSQIHDTWQNGDLYMRTKSTEDGATWSSWHKIVGESGGETNYMFALSANKVSQDGTSATAPSDISSSDWQDAPMAVTSSKPYLWSRVQKKSWNESTQQYQVDSTSYICLTGESAATYNLVPSVSEIVLTKSETYSPERFSCYCTSLKNGVSTNNPSEATMQYSYNDSSWTTFSSTASFLSRNVQQNGGKFYIRLLVNEKVMDKKTLSVVVDGDDGVSYCFVFTKASARVDENNLVTAELAGYAYKYVGDVRSALASTTIRYGYILNDPSTYADTTTNTSGFFDANTWFNNDDITDYGKNSPSIFAAIVIEGTVVHAEMITISKKGSTGNRGKVGRFFYYAEAFDVSDSTTRFLVNDAQSPFFSYNNQYWVYNPETNPSGGYATMAQMGTPSNSSANWKIMTNDFKYIITEAIFGRYAHFGSFIINDDWLISQHGTINGQASTNYTQFDPDHPNDNTGTNFIPNFCVDGLTGKTYQNDAYIRGEVHATSGDFVNGTFVNGRFSGNIYTPAIEITSSNYGNYHTTQTTALDILSTLGSLSLLYKYVNPNKYIGLPNSTVLPNISDYEGAELRIVNMSAYGLVLSNISVRSLKIVSGSFASWTTSRVILYQGDVITVRLTKDNDNYLRWIVMNRQNNFLGNYEQGDNILYSEYVRRVSGTDYIT